MAQKDRPIKIKKSSKNARSPNQKTVTKNTLSIRHTLPSNKVVKTPVPSMNNFRREKIIGGGG